MSSNLLPNMPLYSYPTIPVVTASIPITAANTKVHKRTCSVAGCKNGIVQGGVCVTHGAKRRQCGFPGCTKSSKSAGMCSKHGPARKPCDTEGCNKISVRGTKCKMHAAPSQTCVMEGCRKAAQLGGVCKRHQSTFLEGGAVPLKESAVGARIQVIQPIMAPMGMLPRGAFVQPEYCQMIAAQNMALQGMGMYPGFVAPTLSAGLAPSLGLASLNPSAAGLGGGYGGPFYAHAAYNPSAVSRMASQKQGQGRSSPERAGKANALSTSFLDSFAMP